ncbi:MAG TPA: fasciclin domain-containing protein [Methanocellaceae archaeon]
METIEETPLNDMTAIEVLSCEGEFSNFVRALELSGVGDMLEKKGPYTVFAPNDEAFNMETAGGMSSQARLMNALQYYVVPGRYDYRNLNNLPSLITVVGYPLALKKDHDLTINGAHILRPDIPYNKGIIHMIDQVLYL